MCYLPCGTSMCFGCSHSQAAERYFARCNPPPHTTLRTKTLSANIFHSWTCTLFVQTLFLPSSACRDRTLSCRSRCLPSPTPRGMSSQTQVSVFVNKCTPRWCNNQQKLLLILATLTPLLSALCRPTDPRPLLLLVFFPPSSLPTCRQTQATRAMFTQTWMTQGATSISSCASTSEMSPLAHSMSTLSGSSNNLEHLRILMCCPLGLCPTPPSSRPRMISGITASILL